MCIRDRCYIEDFILILYRHLIGVGVSGSGDGIVAILVIARMVAFNAVDLFANFIFQLGIIRLHAFQIFIFCLVGSPQHHIAAAIDQDGA